MTEFLHLDGLTILYDGRKIVSDVTGRFRCGAVNLIVGRAGSGKSSLLLTIAGFHKEFSGKILDDSGAFKPQGNYSLAFQNPESLFFNPTVGDEVEFALRMRGIQESESVERAKNWLERWGLSPEIYYRKHPLELSGGEKRRVAMAACTVLAPPVMLLDEPLAGLDHRGQKRLAEMLQQFAADHVVIVVTHEPEIFLTRHSQVLFLREGQGLWLKGSEFTRRALQDPDFFPLPGWYQKAIEPFNAVESLPEINAEAVARFLEEVKGRNDSI